MSRSSWNVALTDDELTRIWGEEQFGLFCDEEEFIQIAREIEQQHGIFELRLSKGVGGEH